MRRIRIQVRGVVQGVGFRPYVFGLAQHHGLAGFVRNEPSGVAIEVEGPEAALDAFVTAMQSAPPPFCRIQELRTYQEAVRGGDGFVVLPSLESGDYLTLVGPDRAPCAECLREFSDPADRRYRYPFINCTHCGPRYTLVTGVPYDRARTTMAAFVMCPACRAEYDDPKNRRFQAEPICCPDCGPQLALRDPSGIQIACDDPVEACLGQIAAGRVAAIKGIGGFHLACDARNPDAVAALRYRKQRDHKPFALMVRDEVVASQVAELSGEELGILCSPERPIVLLRKKVGHGLAEGIAPGQGTFGVMLPYSPLHARLLTGALSTLVMTSGNGSDEPIAFTNDDAYRRLGGIADLFLTHNRDIQVRTDDSVLRCAAGGPRFLRRSRGYAPGTVLLPVSTCTTEVLAVGAELSNTVCLTRAGEACLSQHIGDLSNLAAYESLGATVQSLEAILGVRPAIVACDQHPGYASLRYARSRNLPLVQVQHHHAHIASVLAEKGRTGPVIGVAFDGMGWGDDGTLWGGEFLVCDLSGYERVGRFSPVPQPGGDAAARHPARMAYAYLRAIFGVEANRRAGEWLPGLSKEECSVMAQMMEAGVHAPLTSSVGRLFDAASALLGICLHNTYHAQAPMELEAHAAQARMDAQPALAKISKDAQGLLTVQGSDFLASLLESRSGGISVAQCAARFHGALASTTAEVCRRIRDMRGLECVALSGGVFANALLLETLVAILEQEGFDVLLNERVPANDGGISLGQAAVAAWRCACA